VKYKEKRSIETNKRKHTLKPKKNEKKYEILCLGFMSTYHGTFNLPICLTLVSPSFASCLPVS
jgi:hypothetical protein